MTQRGCESARGLAQSKTLTRQGKRCDIPQGFGLRQSSGAFVSYRSARISSRKLPTNCAGSLGPNNPGTIFSESVTLQPLVGCLARSQTNCPDQLRRSGIFVVTRPPRSRLKLRRSGIASRCQHDAAPLGLRWCFWVTRSTKIPLPRSLPPVPANGKVSHRSQPPMAFDLCLAQPADSGWLHRLVRLPV